MMQEPNISDVVETETLGPRPGQIFETDTSSKNPRLENRKFVDYADIFLQIFKKYCRDYEVAIFSNFWYFSYLFWLFLICKYSRPKTRWFYSAIFLQYSKPQTNVLVIETKTRPQTFETETRKMESLETKNKSRDFITA